MLVVCVVWKSSAIRNILEDFWADSYVTARLSIFEYVLPAMNLGGSLIAAAYITYVVGKFQAWNPGRETKITFDLEPVLPITFAYVLAWAMATGSIYCLYIYVHFAVSAYTNECHRKVISGSLSVKDVHLMFSRVQQRRRAINQSLGFIPFTLCVQVFILVTLLKANSMTLEKDDALRTLASAVNAQAILLIAAFIVINVVVEHATSQATELRNQVILCLSKASGFHFEKAVAGLLELTQDPVVPSLAWGVFPMGKQFIFRFFGSLIPFALMVVPMLHDTESGWFGYKPMKDHH
ncbi:hypothetical protein HDE_02598 [Halotydeus destructor]|nr:hypothetical protein HDE_02598 [Halotydeus destructor]